MPRDTRSSRTSYSYYRGAPYNLRSRSRLPNYIETLRDSDNAPKSSLPKVESVVMNEKNVIEHHTDMYKAESMVLRRSQVFSLTVKFATSLSEGQSSSIILSTGRSPYPSKGTLMIFPLTDSATSTKFLWECTATTEDRQVFQVQFRPSPEAFIGLYGISIQVHGEGDDHPHVSYSELESFYLIFNPWSLNDDVFIQDDETGMLKKEYILNETGLVYVGNKASQYGNPWIYGQFESVVLEAALYILETSDLADTAMSNPVIVTRALSKMANSNDDNGVLEGNWSGDYTGGKEPTYWISSVDILKEYMNEKKPVKYGQCWVFASILTSLFRSIGIPVRTISNFESAHDNDASLTMDRHWDHEDKPLTDLNDSVWNFHVWNEAWMDRKDLPTGYGGWQVVDGTPQERSDGVMQCGPASVKAVREGDVYLPFDTKFVFAEVNGDILEWVQDKSGEMSIWARDPSAIGFNISTKSAKARLREDVTAHYKYPEGSTKEREIAAKVTRYSSRREDLVKFYGTETKDTIDFNLHGEGFDNGDIKTTLFMKRKVDKNMTVKATISFTAGYYDGLTSDNLMTSKHTTQIHAGGDETSKIEVLLKGENYLNKIATDATISVFCKADVEGTGQHFFRRENVFIDRPEVELDTERRVYLNESGRATFSVNIAFTNKLSVPLTQCHLSLEGPGITCKPKSLKLASSTIGAGETLKMTVEMTAKERGAKEIICHLRNRQLQNVTGCWQIEVL